MNRSKTLKPKLHEKTYSQKLYVYSYIYSYICIAKNITHEKKKLSLFILENSLKEFYLIKWPYESQEPTDGSGSKTFDHSLDHLDKWLLANSCRQMTTISFPSFIFQKENCYCGYIIQTKYWGKQNCT